MPSNNKNKKKISFKDYPNETNFNDYLPSFNDIEGEDPRAIDDENNNYEYTMRIFPNPDW